MKMNLWLLARQAGAAAVLRFRPARFYAYGLRVFVLVWAAVGMVNAVALKPFLGAGDAAIGFGFLTAVTRYLVLTRVFWELLRAPDGERVPFWGYVLATEALAIPTLFLGAVCRRGGNQRAATFARSGGLCGVLAGFFAAVVCVFVDVCV